MSNLNEQPQQPERLEQKADLPQSSLNSWVGKEARRRGPEAIEAKKKLASLFAKLGPATNFKLQEKIGNAITNHVNNPDGLFDELASIALEDQIPELAEALQLTFKFPGAGKES